MWRNTFERLYIHSYLQSVFLLHIYCHHLCVFGFTLLLSVWMYFKRIFLGFCCYICNFTELIPIVTSNGTRENFVCLIKFVPPVYVCALIEMPNQIYVFLFTTNTYLVWLLWIFLLILYWWYWKWEWMSRGIHTERMKVD